MFAKRLKLLREKVELKQSEVAERLGLPRTTYCGYEQGKREPTFEILKNIAEYFDVTIDYLLGKTDHPQTILKYDLPKELIEFGIDCLEVSKEMEGKTIPKEDARKIVAYVEIRRKMKSLG